MNDVLEQLLGKESIKTWGQRQWGHTILWSIRLTPADLQLVTLVPLYWHRRSCLAYGVLSSYLNCSHWYVILQFMWPLIKIQEPIIWALLSLFGLVLACVPDVIHELIWILNWSHHWPGLYYRKNNVKINLYNFRLKFSFLNTYNIEPVYLLSIVYVQNWLEACCTVRKDHLWCAVLIF